PLAPRSAAARSRLRSNASSRADTTRMTNGVASTVWPMMAVSIDGWMCSTLVASTRMATPISRPGIMIGSVMKTLTPPRFLMLARTSGKAAMVPMTVESTVTQKATINDFSKELKITVSGDSLEYQWVVNPAIGKPTTREELNDSRIITAIDAKRKM